MMICASENSAIIDKEFYAESVDLFVWVTLLLNEDVQVFDAVIDSPALLCSWFVIKQFASNRTNGRSRCRYDCRGFLAINGVGIALMIGKIITSSDRL